MVYPVHDEIHSFIDAENFYSLQFRKKISEGKYRADESIVYDYDKKIAFYESFKNGSKKEIPLEEYANQPEKLLRALTSLQV